YVSAVSQQNDHWIYRIPRAGGVPTKLFTGSSFAIAPNNITVDGDYLYWNYSSTPGAKSIVRGPKSGGVADEVVDALVNDPSPEAKVFGFVMRPDRIYYAANYKEGDA